MMNNHKCWISNVLEAALAEIHLLQNIPEFHRAMPNTGDRWGDCDSHQWLTTTRFWCISRGDDISPMVEGWISNGGEIKSMHCHLLSLTNWACREKMIPPGSSSSKMILLCSSWMKMIQQCSSLRMMIPQGSSGNFWRSGSRWKSTFELQGGDGNGQGQCQQVSIVWRRDTDVVLEEWVSVSGYGNGVSGVAQCSIGSMLHAAVPAKIKVGRV